MRNLLIVFFISLSGVANSQFATAASRSELGVMVGGMFYIGDMNPLMPYKNTHLSIGAAYRYNIHTRLTFRANLLYGNVSGYDSGSKSAVIQNRNLNFHSEIYEFSAGVEFNYFPFKLGHDRYKGTAYLMAGLGVFYMNPRTSYNGLDVDLRPLGTEGQGTSLNGKGYYSQTQLCVPLGVGVKLSLGKRTCLSFEIGIRKTFTDYIDDIKSESYVDPAVLALENGQLAADISNRSGNQYGPRGDSGTKDWYVFSGAMLTFRLGNPRKCQY